MDSDEFFLDEDFFPYISSLYDDMGDNTTYANESSSIVLYVILFLLLKIMMKFLVLISCLEFIMLHYMLDGMYIFFPLILAIFYLFFG
jgi:hypothetical protein